MANSTTNVILAMTLALTLAACETPARGPIAGELPRMTDADAYARVFMDRLQAASFDSNREFCGLFARDAEGYVIATKPVMGDHYRCQPPNVPDSVTPFASYHTHGAFDPEIDSEVPSSFDLVADREEGLVGYISTPGGRLWRSAGGNARLLCGPGCIAADPDYQTAFAPVKRSYTADELRRREREAVD